MAKKKHGDGHGGGGHGWFVTFADLMGLLVAFFVMLAAFSTQDKIKMQMVAGSMREAFGVQREIRHSGMVELDGLPTRPHLKNAARIEPRQATDRPAPDRRERPRDGTPADDALAGDPVQAFALAIVSLQQEVEDLSAAETQDAGQHPALMVAESEAGLNIEIIDREGRAMFPDGLSEPYERTRRLIEKLALRLKGLPYRLSLAGHTAASPGPRSGEASAPEPRAAGAKAADPKAVGPKETGAKEAGPWELSADRANAVRRILEEEGVAAAHFHMVAGRADTEPLFVEDPSLAGNRRVTITLMRPSLPLPPGFRP